MRQFEANTFSEVYESSLNDLFYNPEYISNPRNLEIKENLGVSLKINDPTMSMYLNDRRSSQSRYIAAELLWYFLGRNDVSYIEKYASFWKSIQNEDGTVNSAYGNLIFSTKNRYGMCQYEWAIDSLLKDKDSRQAIMHFNLPSHQFSENKDFVCTMYGIFHIRDNKLNLSINMRSNDAILGTPTDVAFFTLLQQQALNHLRSNYPNLQLGSYTHNIDSYHIYDKHFPLVKKMLENKFTPVKFPTLSKNLITQTGIPLDTLKVLDNHKSEYAIVCPDSVYSWIQNNIKEKDEANV
jgi:thymidylate synthase